MNAILRGAVSIITMALLLSPILQAQQPTKKAKPSDPQLKGVWEPVNYPVDLVLNDVFFVTPEVGWVTGAKPGTRGGGVVLHTRDGGSSWSPQLGDAESDEAPFRQLHFLDERNGWVLQGAGIGKHKLLRTTDAENWDQVGLIETKWGLLDYSFTSTTTGVYLDGNDNVARIMHTSDGGRTWEEAYQCKTKLQIQGLTKDLSCNLKSLHFPSVNVGYAVGGAHGAKRMLFVAKTVDTGKTWTLSAVSDIGGDLEVYFTQEVYFTDEKNGFVHLSDKRLYRTTDGGVTWKGLVSTPGPEVEFADPHVGWAFFSQKSLSYTTDGGKRWTSRAFAFPARVNAFSLPRRDRAYVVGEHGMIYRYRLARSTEAVSAKALAAPAMPAFDSPLDERIGEMDSIVEALTEAVASAPDSAAPADEPVATSDEEEEVATSDEEDEVVEDADVAEDIEVAEASAFTAGCCSKPLGKLDLVLTAVTGIVPQFLGQYKNTNLLLAGIRMLTDLPGKVNELNSALRAFRKAPDKQAAQVAVARVATAVQGLSRSTAIAFQKQLPPAQQSGEEAAAAAGEGQTADREVQDGEMTQTDDAAGTPSDELEETSAQEEEVTPSPPDESAEEAVDETQ